MLVRLGAASELAYATDVGMLPVLLTFSEEHDDPAVRAYALRGLSNYREPRVLDLASEGLAAPDAEIRAAAAYSAMPAFNPCFAGWGITG